MYRLLAAAPHVLLTAEENAERERRNARLLRLIRFVDQNYMHKNRLSDFARAERHYHKLSFAFCEKRRWDRAFRSM